jgi:hypothetical protein
VPQNIRRISIITAIGALAVLGVANRAYAIELTAHGVRLMEPVLDSMSLLLFGSGLTFVGARLRRRDTSVM